MSGRQDSNLRPPAPKAGAITGLRYAPMKTHPGEPVREEFHPPWRNSLTPSLCGEGGIRTLGTV